MRRDADGIRGDTAGFAWSDAKRIFLEVLEKPREQRLEYAVELCGEDSDLYREVMSLLQNYDGANSFLETPPAGPIAARLDLMVGRRIGAYQKTPHPPNHKCASSIKFSAHGNGKK